MRETLSLLLAQDFMVRAIVAGLIIALCSALLGVSLVLKRYATIGDGLSHVGFGALTVAAAANLAPLQVALPVVTVAAVLLLRLSESSKIKGDAAIAMVSTTALAAGVLVASVTTGMTTDLNAYMFGSILALSWQDVYLCLGLGAVVLALFSLSYHRLFLTTFDEGFARATGTRAGRYNLLIALLTAVTVVLGMRMMGTLLISALMIFPPTSAMRVCKRFSQVVAVSAVISVFCFVLGMVGSFWFNTPSGASVVAVNILVFCGFSLVGLVRKKG